MRKLALRTVALAAVLAMLGAGSYAIAGGGKKNVDADLLGYEEVPSVSSTGLGTFEARIDEDDALIHYTLSYAGLEGPVTTQAHIHLGQRTANGGVSVFLCGGGGKPPCPPIAGTVSGTISPADIVGPAVQGLVTGEFAELVRAIRAGVTYANVHTTKHPSGEIRGQINDDNQRNDD